MDATQTSRKTGRNVFHAVLRAAALLAICFAGFISFPEPESGQVVRAAPAPALPPEINEDAWQNILRVIDEDQAATGPQSPLGDAWLETAQVLPEDLKNGQAFGYSVAIDGSTLVVGAYWDSTDGPAGSGSAYVFKKPSGGWSAVTQVVKLLASDRAMHDTFGWSVAISGDTIVVGAPGDCSGTPISDCHGSAYVFENQPSSSPDPVTEDAKLMPNPSSLNNPDEFGYSVDISGSTIVVGDWSTDVFQDEGYEIDRGMVYVFDRPGASWESEEVIYENALLSASDGGDYDYLGGSVAIDGNYIVAGAHGHPIDEMVGAGEAYIFYHLGNWVNDDEDARLTASDAAAHEYFGWSVDIAGGPVVVGAPGEQTFDNNGGESAYVFVWPGEWPGWVGDFHETFVISASDGAIGDDFGKSVAIDEDVIIVGAPYDENYIMDPNQGSAYVFQFNGPPWPDLTETCKLTASDIQEAARFGTRVAVSEGIVLVGAPLQDVSTYMDQGEAYIFVPAPTLDQFVYIPLVVK